MLAKFVGILILSVSAVSCSASFQSSRLTGSANRSDPPPASADASPVPVTIPESPFPALRDCRTSPPINLCGFASLGANLKTVQALGSDQTLDGIRLSSTKLDLQTWQDLKVTASCLSQSSFISSLWNRGELKSSEMILTELSRTTWKDMHFVDSDLRLSHFAAADFSEVKIDNTCLAAVNWSSTHFQNVAFDNTLADRGNFSGILSQGTFQFTRGSLNASNLSGAIFEGPVNWQDSDLRAVNFTGVVFKDSVNWQGVQLSGATWMDGRICAEGSVGTCD